MATITKITLNNQNASVLGEGATEVDCEFLRASLAFDLSQSFPEAEIEVYEDGDDNRSIVIEFAPETDAETKKHLDAWVYDCVQNTTGGVRSTL